VQGAACDCLQADPEVEGEKHANAYMYAAIRSKARRHARKGGAGEANRLGERIVTNEADHPMQAMDRRLRLTRFPVDNRPSADVHLLCDFVLQEPPIHPPLLDVLSNGPRMLRIALRNRLAAPSLRMA